MRKKQITYLISATSREFAINGFNPFPNDGKVLDSFHDYFNYVVDYMVAAILNNNPHKLLYQMRELNQIDKEYINYANSNKFEVDDYIYITFRDSIGLFEGCQLWYHIDLEQKMKKDNFSSIPKGIGRISPTSLINSSKDKGKWKSFNPNSSFHIFDSLYSGTKPVYEWEKVFKRFYTKNTKFSNTFEILFHAREQNEGHFLDANNELDRTTKGKIDKDSFSNQIVINGKINYNELIDFLSNYIKDDKQLLKNIFVQNANAKFQINPIKITWEKTYDEFAICMKYIKESCCDNGHMFVIVKNYFCIATAKSADPFKNLKATIGKVFRNVDTGKSTNPKHNAIKDFFDHQKAKQHH